MTEQERVKKQEARDRIKRRLYAYQEAKAEAQQIREELARVEVETTAPSTSDWSGMPHGGGYSDQMASKVSARIRLQEKYRQQLERLDAAQLAVEETIDSLKPVERLVLRCRYIDGLTWENVCVAVNYSWRQTHNIHSRALDKLVEKESPEH